MNKDILVVHSSDLHVDAEPAFPGQDGAAGLALVLEAARRVKADMLLLAGDTFESHRQPDAFVDRIFAMFAAFPAPVVILPGNHDPVVPEAVYHRIRDGAVDLHVLGVTDDEAIVFHGLDLEVWGRAHRGYADMSPLEHVRPRNTRWQLAMAHGHYQPQPDRSTPLRPSWLIGDEELAATKADYVALGHWNRAVNVGRTEFAAYYSGSPDVSGTANLVRLGADGQVQVVRTPLGNHPGP